MLTDTDEISKHILSNVPVKRFGTPEEVANVVAFLASDESSYVVGETVVVSGGLHARL